jgi:putative transcriptional regulator
MPSSGPIGKSLKGSLILADPGLKEPTFFQSVLLVTEHSCEGGAFAYILNRPLGQCVGDLLIGNVLPHDQRERLADVPVFMGGPVSTEHLTFSALGWSDIDATLQYSTHLSAAEAVMHEMEGFQIRAFIGYSGWSGGQLEGELRQQTWIIRTPSKSIIEVSNVDRLWKTLLRDLSPWHKLVADEPEDLSLN